MAHCDLDRGDRYVVIGENQGDTIAFPRHLDLRNCDWGTDNPDSIQAWIYDRRDDPHPGMFVDWDPFAPESTPVEAESLGDITLLLR
jgi:hypothetical protein